MHPTEQNRPALFPSNPDNKLSLAQISRRSYGTVSLPKSNLMKIKKLFVALALLALSMIDGRLSSAFAQGTTAFTFQGRLNALSGAANGSYDMKFAVWDANVAGDLIAGPITNSAVAVSNGLFTATLDFGPGIFTGTNYWVEMAVCTNGSGNFVTLVPRQQLTPAPYALNLSAPLNTGLCPPGSVMAYMGTTAPTGWLLCDGSAVSRTNYPALFAVLGTSCGGGDGATTFNLPDCRGVFLRGANGVRGDSFADPDSGARTNIFPGGNSGNAIGTYQADIFAAHSHQVADNEQTGGSTAVAQAVFNGTSLDPNHWSNVKTGQAGGDETRPKNIYVNYIIKY